jgi:hypothetical protein
MRRTLLFLSLVFVIFACERFDDPIPEGSSLESPRLYSRIVSPDKVELTWFSNLICQQICPSIVSATVYEIWRKSSSVSSNFKIGEVPAGSDSFMVEGLETGVSHQFFVIAKRADVSNRTNTVMVVPNDLPVLDKLFESKSFDYITYPKVSVDGTKIAYSISQAGARGPTQNTFLFDVETSISELILKNAQYPSWSFEDDRLLLLRENADEFFLDEYTFAMAESDEKGRNLDPVYYPVYTSDSTAVYFSYRSDRGDQQLISLNLVTGEKTALRDVKYVENNQAPFLGMSYAREFRRLAYGVSFPKENRFGFAYDIVGFDLRSPNLLLTWEASEWNDIHPSFSNSNPNFMAFISDRSGTDQVWVKNLNTGRLLQVTDFQSGERIIVAITGLSWFGESVYLNSGDVMGITKALRVDLADLLP